MPFCPKCRTQYREGFSLCSDCKIPLVDELTDDYEIDVILLERDFDEGDETFQLSCHLIISLDEGVITDIEYDNRVWGGDGLGDVNPGEICKSSELNRMARTEKALLKAITE